MSALLTSVLMNAAAVAGAAIGLIFVAAGASKVLRWGELASVVAEYRVVGSRTARVIAAALPPTELVLGVILVCRPRLPGADALGSSLLCLFAVAMAVNLHRGRRAIDCGCFGGALIQRLDWRLVARNIVCALILLFDAVGPSVTEADLWLIVLPGGLAFFVLQAGMTAMWALDGSTVAERA